MSVSSSKIPMEMEEEATSGAICLTDSKSTYPVSKLMTGHSSLTKSMRV